MSATVIDAAWIRAELHRTGKTQRELAEAMGIDGSNVSRLLDGQRELKSREIPIIRAFFEGPAGRRTTPLKLRRYQPEGDASPEEQGFIDRLRYAIRSANVSIVDLAKASGIRPEAIIALVEGRDSRTLHSRDIISRKQMADFIQHLGVETDWLEKGDRISTIRPTRNNKLTMSVRLPSYETIVKRRVRARQAVDASSEAGDYGFKAIPTYRAPVRQQDGSFLLDSNIAEYRVCPPQLLRVLGAYALFIPDDSLAPRYRSGEVIYLNPARPAQVGDYALIQLRAPADRQTAVIAEIVGIDSSRIQLKAPNGNTVFYLERANIGEIHRIILCSVE
jgi:transcriptional regulator with XRE-family HTH domain